MNDTDYVFDYNAIYLYIRTILEVTFYVKLIRSYFTLVSKISPYLSMKSAYKLFHTPIKMPQRKKEVKLLESAETFLVHVDADITIQAYRWGELNNPIILIVHGWSSSSTNMSLYIQKLLKMDYQVISYDAIGHGKSKGGFSSLYNWTKVLRTVLKEVGEVHCILAHSLGCASVTIASNLGLNSSKLVLISPLNNAVAVTDRFGIYFHIPLKHIEKMRTYTWGKDKEGFLKYGKDWQDIFISDFKVPTLIVHDKDDEEISIEDARLLQKSWTWAKLIETNNLGHRRILYDKHVIREVLGFIASK